MGARPTRGCMYCRLVWYYTRLLAFRGHVCDGLYVANCGHPMINSLIGVVDYDNDDLPTEQGATINFTCPPNMSFNGTNSITCMDNGKWEPDPSNIHCKQGKLSMYELYKLKVYSA